jgi:hypothetical protein
VYTPPLVATGTLLIADWARDDLPDLLWPLLALAKFGTEGVRRFVLWQQAVQGDISGLAEPGLIAECLDGRLTGLDRLSNQIPEAKAAIKSRAGEQGLLPDLIESTLSSYPSRPAEWLVDCEVKPPGQEEIDLLARAVFGVLKEGHHEALIKCLYVWSAVQAGTFRTSTETIELLKFYPNDPSTRSQADSVIRAMWGAQKRLLLHKDENYFETSTAWARVFWDTNSMTSRCVRSLEDDAGEEGGSGMGPQRDNKPDEELAPSPTPGGGMHLRRLAMDFLSSYVEALEMSPARLQDRERQEVHSGLVARVGRDVIAVLGAPDLWCMEHGAHIARTLVEVRIYIQWMAQQDPTTYRDFQEYGAGKAKLYARILDEVPAEARQSDFVEAVEELERLSHNSGIIDHRIVDTRDSFADGKAIRKMAEECGLLDFYRQTYSMASGISHSEWWSVETHAMERCRNILHGGHLIPSLSLGSGGNVKLAGSWVDQLYTLIRISLQILGTDEQAVQQAFAWLDSDADGDTPEDDPAAEDRS